MTIFKASRDIKLLGLLLDVIGGVIIGLSVVRINKHVQDIHSTQSLGSKSKEELEHDSTTTIIGIVLIIVGFVLIFGDEVYKDFSKSSKKRRK